MYFNGSALIQMETRDSHVLTPEVRLGWRAKTIDDRSQPDYRTREALHTAIDTSP